MRIGIILLALFCAVISGWTAVLAQVRDLSPRQPMHHMTVTMDHATAADADKRDCANAAKGCKHHGKSIHPILCAACYALSTESDLFAIHTKAAGRIAPRTQAALRPAILKPRFPPPKLRLFL